MASAWCPSAKFRYTQSARQLYRECEMNTSELAYPVIGMNKKGQFDVSTDEEWLTTSYAASLKPSPLHLGNVIVDSNGVAAQIQDVRIVRGKGRFWGYTIFLDRIVTVDITLGEPFNMSVDKLRPKVMRLVKWTARSQDPSYWAERIRQMEEATSVGEFIALLLPEWDRRVVFR